MGRIPVVRIQSDGAGPTTVITGPDGREIPNVTSANIYLSVDAVNEVNLEIQLPELDVHAAVKSVTFSCRCCGADLVHECEPNPTLGGP